MTVCNRSAVALAATAYGLTSIDLVCIVSISDLLVSRSAAELSRQHYQDLETLLTECVEGT